MRKTFTYLSLLIAFMFAGTMKGWAQFKAELTTDPVEVYVAGYVAFDPAVIAEALETDTAALHAAIAASGNYYLATADGRTNAYTGNPDLNEFWLDNDANPVGYGSGNTWFTGLEYVPAGVDSETGESYSDSIYISFGQMPDVFRKVYTPTVLKATTYLVVDEKEISFEIIQNINAAPEPTLTAPVTKLSGLTIVGEWTLELPFYLGKSYEGLTYSTTLDGVYDALGVSQTELDASATDYIFTQLVVKEDLLDSDGNPTGEVAYSLSDSLARPEEASGGAWYGRYINYDEATAAETPLEINGPMNWGAGCTFYTQGMTLAEGEYSIVSGQYHETFTAVGESDSTYHYLIVGDKAAKIKVVARIIEMPVIDPSEMVQVGDTTISISAAVDNSYMTKAFTIDMEAVAAALGCAVGDIIDVYAYDQSGAISDNQTQAKGGFFFNFDGKIDNWGSTAACFTSQTSLPDGQYNIGQMQGAFTDITEDTTVYPQLIFQYLQNYYVVTIEYTVTAPIVVTEFIKVADETVYMQIIPSNEVWEWETKASIDLEFVERNIGTQDFVLYADLYTAPDSTNSEATWEFSKYYTCDPAPGFWMSSDTFVNPEGKSVVHNAGWGSNSFGVCYASGQLTFFQYPGQRSAGDSFEGYIYAVNEATGQYVRYLLNVEYVDAVVETEVVGEEDLMLMIKESEEPTYCPVDVEKVATAFGIDVDLLLNTAEFKILKSATSYTSDNLDAYGWWLDENGYCIDPSNDEAAMVSPANLGYEFDYQDVNGTTHLFALFTASPLGNTPADGKIIKTKFAVEYDAKLYVFNISIMNEETYTGIEDVEVAGSAAAGNVFDISGRLVRKAATSVNGLAKGIYILNGKKYIVK